MTHRLNDSSLFSCSEQSIFDDREQVVQSQAIVNDNARIPVFGEIDTWDLRAIGYPPNLSPGSARVSFTRFDGSWNLLARELSMILLNPHHPVLVARGLSGGRNPARASTLQKNIENHLHKIQTWALSTGRSEETSSWTPRDADEFLAFIQKSYAPSSVRGYLVTYRLLYQFRSILSSGGITQEPWPAQITSASLARSRPSKELITMPIPPSQWYSVVSAAWLYVGQFSKDIEASRRILSAPLRPSSVSPATAREQIRRWLKDPSNLIPVHVHVEGRSRLEEVNFQRLLIEITGYRWNNTGSIRQGVAQAVKQKVLRGETSLGQEMKVHVRGADSVSRAWRPPIETARELATEETYLRTASYLIISALTMMRDSEVQGIRKDSIVSHFGSPAIKSVKVKKDPSFRERFWWASEPVCEALRVLALQNPNSDFAFGVFRQKNAQRNEMPPALIISGAIKQFIEHVNSHAAQWSLTRTTTRINGRRLRRTMAIIAGSAQDGPVAVAMQLKHATTFAVANQLSSAYSAPDVNWANELRNARRTASEIHLMEQWAESDAAGKPRAQGPGRARATEGFALDASADEKEQFGPTVGNSDLGERLALGKFPNVSLGTINHCLGDVEVAACLSRVEKDRGERPRPTMCRPDTCKNSFTTIEHVPILQSERRMLENYRITAHRIPAMKKVLDYRIAQIDMLLESGGEQDA